MHATCRELWSGGIAHSFLTSRLDWVIGNIHTPAAWPSWGPQRISGHAGEEKNILILPGIEPRYLECCRSCLVTVLTEQSPLTRYRADNFNYVTTASFHSLSLTIIHSFDVIRLETLTASLNFRHRASCILGQAFHYSPENAFYTFNQQIYFIIWYLLDRTSLI